MAPKMTATWMAARKLNNQDLITFTQTIKIIQTNIILVKQIQQLHLQLPPLEIFQKLCYYQKMANIELSDLIQELKLLNTKVNFPR